MYIVLNHLVWGDHSVDYFVPEVYSNNGSILQSHFPHNGKWGL